MAEPALEELQRDDLAMSVARALSIANEAAIAEGTEPNACLVTIAEESPPPERLWRIHYGPRDYTHRRGGDLIIVVDERGGVRQILRGQ